MYLSVITLLAALLRFYQLSSLPAGLHGDEGVAGLEALRILREGYIGPYSPLALGQPTGPLYLMALPVKLLGNTILAVRVLPALTGVLAVPALWWLIRRYLNHLSAPLIALVAAGLLAFLNWHLHFSRIGFPVGFWPLWGILNVFIVLEAQRRERLAWWLAAGAITGGGLYIYNAHSLFLAIVTVFVGIYLMFKPATMAQRVKHAGAFAAGLLIVLAPMLAYVANPANDYWSHARMLSVFQAPEWTSLTRWGPKLGFLTGKYLDYWDRLSLHPVSEYTDAIGGDGDISAVPPLILLTALAGVLWVLRHSFRKPNKADDESFFLRQPLLVLSTLLVLGMPMAGVLTTNAPERRSLAAAPFLCLLAAWAAVQLINRMQRRRPNFRKAIFAVAGVLWLWLCVRSVNDYFNRYAHSRMDSWVSVAEMTAALQWAKTLPPDHYIYFLSDRWTINYETRQYLAPELRGEDRSREFGQYHLGVVPEQGKPVFILLGNYRGELANLQKMYPDGRVVQGELKNDGSGEPTFAAYFP